MKQYICTYEQIQNVTAINLSFQSRFMYGNIKNSEMKELEQYSRPLLDLMNRLLEALEDVAVTQDISGTGPSGPREDTTGLRQNY